MFAIMHLLCYNNTAFFPKTNRFRNFKYHQRMPAYLGKIGSLAGDGVACVEATTSLTRDLPTYVVITFFAAIIAMFHSFLIISGLNAMHHLIRTLNMC